MVNSDKLILIGIISSAHGVQGEVIIKSFTDPITNILKLAIINNKNESIVLKLVKVKPDNSIICKVKNIETRTEAEKLKGSKLFTLRSNLPNLLHEEFYIEDLIGLAVIDPESNNLGIVNNVFNFGASDIIEVKFNNDSLELFPFTKKFFPIITNIHIVLNTN